MRARRDEQLTDHYALLGIARAAGTAEVRRAFRTLALRHHPDRAGHASTEVFQRISEAYAILSDPSKRARYDDRLTARDRRPGAAVAREVPRPPGAPGPAAPAADGASAPGAPDQHHGEFQGPGGRIGWRRNKATSAPAGPFLDRLSGSLESLLARGVARRVGDGIVDLLLDTREASTGGHAAIDAAVSIACPTCGGMADHNVLWCRRCDHAGTVIDQVTFTLELPPQARDGAVFTFVTDPSHQTPPFRVRLRRA